jgi:hypothetical protein
LMNASIALARNRNAPSSIRMNGSFGFFAGAMIPHPILAYIQPSPDILDGKQRIVLDNGHRVSDDVLAETVRSMGAARWVVLAQEWPGRELFATATGARAEVLAGWSRDSIASVAAAIGCFGSIENYQSLHDLTGGLPLFVGDAVRICKEGYRGDVAAYVNDLAEHLSLQTTSQEVIVSQVLRRLSEDARAFASLLSIFTVPFSRDVVLQVIALR